MPHLSHGSCSCIIAAVCLILLVCLATTAAQPPSIDDDHSSSSSTSPITIKRGRLLLSSVALLDDTLDVTQQHDAHRLLCCLKLTAYTPAPTDAAPGTGTLAATFSTCSNSSDTSAGTAAAGCRAALTRKAASLMQSGMYNVALLLPTQHQQQPVAPSVAAAADSASSVDDSSSDAQLQHTAEGDGSSSISAATVNVNSFTAADTATTQQQPMANNQPTLSPAPAQHSSKRSAGLLLTIHAEQEVAGQVYLTTTTQLVPAGTGVVRVNINMSHYSHTWTSPQSVLNALADAATAATNTTASSSSTLEAAAAPPPPDVAPASGEPLPPESTHTASSNSTDLTQKCQPMPAQEQTTTSTVTSSDALSNLMPAQLAGNPAALASYLQTVLGHDVHISYGGNEVQVSGCAAAAATNSKQCMCPALSTTDAVDSSLAAVFTCPTDDSLHSYLAAHAAAAAAAAVVVAESTAHKLSAQQHMQGLLRSLASNPAVAPVLEWFVALGLPVVSDATPEQLLLLGLTGAALSLLLLLVVSVSRCSSSRHHSNGQHQHATQAVKQQQQQHHKPAAAIPAAPAVQDAWPQHHQQDQNEESLDDMLDAVDADPFGYGAPPPPPLAPVAAPGSSGSSGSMLAAAHVVKRASVMAAAEAAGALKDAFMRNRNTNQPAAAAAAAAAGMGPSAAAATVAATGGVNKAWMIGEEEEEDEERVNQLPASAQKRLQAGGRWARDGEGRLVRSSWKGAVRNSLAAAANAVMAAVGSGGKAAAAAAAGLRLSQGAVVEQAAGGADGGGSGEGDDVDAAALRELLSAAPGAVVSFAGQ